MIAKPLARLPRFFRRFIRTEASSGVVMLGFAALAIILANSDAAGWYHALVETPLSLAVGKYGITHTLPEWTEDLLMVLFFFVIGMELKRETLSGFLAKRNQIMLPAMAALGGMAFPALIYAAANWDNPGVIRGWGIPTATDIAFALAALQLAANRLPQALKIFLLTVAFFDDLGAILVIALFYAHDINELALAASAAMLGVLFLMNRFGIRRLPAYLAAGSVLWLTFYYSGVHTTIAGVLLGFAIPHRNSGTPSPLERSIDALHPWVSFGILPLFAFSSAGISLSGADASMLLLPLPLGILLGLFFGKQLGIFLVSRAVVACGLASLPPGVRWPHIYAVALLGGIGFTMSLFIALLAFTDPMMQAQAKLGIMAGSLLSAFSGVLLLKILARHPATHND